MNETLVERWNASVRNGDIVYHLGDFAFGSPDRIASLLARLKGRLFICLGSHDRNLVRACKQARNVEGLKESYLVSLNLGGKRKQKLFLSHHCHLVWPYSRYGSWHLFGHFHGGYDELVSTLGKMLDVGVDSHDFFPWSLQEVLSVMENRPPNLDQRTSSRCMSVRPLNTRGFHHVAQSGMT
ncbi:hypothetical protein [Candidatus Solincola tengchongensis]|uniref:hypothetical protein n=1 Tax=Candidatus Solincola tengchongensis TaxID=2900693 RepID=UPI00257FCFA0|nr:hypothetical protein [Candidatus Solincola tengchongensis]